MITALTIHNRQRARSIDTRHLAKIIRTVTDKLLQSETVELGIYLVGSARITLLNESFLGHAGPTDVITFPYTDSRIVPKLWGEVFVCVSEAVEQSRHFRTSWQKEVVRYIIHGVLHLLGYDDHSKPDRARMKRAENRLVAQVAARFDLGLIERKPGRKGPAARKPLDPQPPKRP